MKGDALQEARRAVAVAAAPDIFAVRPLRALLAVAGVRPSLFTAEPRGAWSRPTWDYQEMLDARDELHLVTTDLCNGREVVISSGDAASAVVASAAIPVSSPPVWRQGRVLIDVASLSTRHPPCRRPRSRRDLPPARRFPCALPAGAHHGCRGGPAGAVAAEPTTADREVARYTGPAKLKVLPPLCP
jgi:NTE family protein